MIFRFFAALLCLASVLSAFTTVAAAQSDDYSRMTAEELVQACDSGDGEGCYILGARYAIGEGVGPNLSRAAELYEQACDGGVAVGCHNLGFVYSTGEYVERNPAQAVIYFRKALAIMPDLKVARQHLEMLGEKP